MANAQVIKRGARFKDLSGQVFGSLRAIQVTGKAIGGSIIWQCLCDTSLGGCGAIANVRGIHLRSGHTRSCGCLLVRIATEVNTTHGMTKSAEYNSWYGMKQRCTNRKHKSFDKYGKRGIRVCKRWLDSFERFFADMGRKPTSKHSLERLNNDGDYEPSNCIWATKFVQAQNTRRNTMLTCRDETKCISEWARDLNLTPATICKRINRGWPIERALS